MNKKNRLLQGNYFKAFIFLLVLTFTFILRAHNYERVPTANHLDEMLYAWSGLNLVETGVPVSWSTLSYPERAKVYTGRMAYKGGAPETYVTLYKPWLDEPPLFSLIVGYFAHLYKADRHDFVPSSYIRLPVVIFSTLTSIGIFFLARLISGFWTGILAMLLYGTIPLMVFASRTAMPENLIALILTSVSILLLKFSQVKKFWYILPIPILIGLAGLSKPTGFFILPLAVFIVLVSLYQDKNWRKLIKYLLYLILLTLPFIGVFFAYGLYFDPQIFWNITFIQSSRPAGFNSLAWFFISPSFSTTIFKDSWYIFGLLSAAYFIFSGFHKRILQLSDLKNKSFIVFVFVYWVIIVMISGGEGDLLAWYRFPALPFLAIITAWGLQYLISRADYLATFLVVGLLLGNRLLMVNPFRPNISAPNFRVMFSMLMLPSLANIILNRSWLNIVNRVVLIVVIIVGIYINSVYIYNAFELECENLSCPIVPQTKLSSVHFPIIWRFFVLGPPKYK